MGENTRSLQTWRVSYHILVAFLYVRPANKAYICVFLSFFLFVSPRSTCFPSLILCLLFPHFLLTPKGKKRVCVSRRFSLAPSSWEKEAEDMAGHMGPCGGALMIEWEAIPCYGAWGQQFWLHALIYSSLKQQIRTCCLSRGFLSGFRMHTLITATFSCTHLHPPPKQNSWGLHTGQK